MTAPERPAAQASAEALEVVQLLITLLQAQSKYRRAGYALQTDYWHASKTDFAEGYIESANAEQAFWSFATLERLQPLLRLLALAPAPAPSAPAETLREAAQLALEVAEAHREWQAALDTCAQDPTGVFEFGKIDVQRYNPAVERLHALDTVALRAALAEAEREAGS